MYIKQFDKNINLNEIIFIQNGIDSQYIFKAATAFTIRVYSGERYRTFTSFKHAADLYIITLKIDSFNDDNMTAICEVSGSSTYVATNVFGEYLAAGEVAKIQLTSVVESEGIDSTVTMSVYNKRL